MRVDGAGDRSGAEAVARFFDGRARTARPALIDGAVGVAVVTDGKIRVLMRFTVAGGRITTIDASTDPSAAGEVIPL
jgi:RNA polymerase sigma-70 factor (ECF subfamily)